MIFYERETWLGLVIAALPALCSVYFFFIADKKGTALFLLLTSVFLIRMVMVSLDPFLHEWDERFHALVAKNMIEFPFKPMLFAHPIVVHDYKEWSYSHIWLNKQPLFLWQMALSLKIFGINLLALRLPSVLMSTALVWLTYDLCRKWIGNTTVAFIAAFITALGNYSLELVSGHNSLDHNDLAFLFYITCSFWAFTLYIQSEYKLWWAVAIGSFVGFAILNKWLAALLIYGGWCIYLVLDSKKRFQPERFTHVLLSLLVTFIVFVPWQIYIKSSFPLEYAHISAYNKLHFTDALGHPGSIFYHIEFLPVAYDYSILLFFIIGSVCIFSLHQVNKKITISFLSMILFIILFFSLLVKTKMPSYVYPVSSLIIVISAYGLYSSIDYLTRKHSVLPGNRKFIFLFSTLVIGILALKPWTIAQNRSMLNEKRNIKIYNTGFYKNMDEEMFKDRVIINCREYENIDLMFFRNVTAYHFYPDEQTIDSLQMHGHRFLAFDYLDHQKLPDYIRNDKEILILEDNPR